MAQNRERKVLRTRIQTGDAVQEREVKPNEAVTIGESPKNTFVVPLKDLPSSEFTLFRPTADGGYALQITEAMAGKIQEHHGSGANAPVVTLKSLLNDPTVSRADGIVSVPINDQHRGKITIGDTTVLFQFVAPPLPAKPVAPVHQGDFRPRMIDEDDPVFLGFLGIWSAVGIVLAIWVWRTEPRPFTLDDVPDRYVQLIRQPEPQPEPELVTEDVGTAQEREAEVDQTDQTSTPREQARAEKRRKDQIAAGSALLMRYVGTQGASNNGVVERMWGDGEAGLGDVDQMLATAGAATGDAGEAGTRMGNEGGNEAAQGGGIDRIGGGAARGVAGPKVTVKPKVTAGTGSVDAVSGSENEVRATVRQYQGQLRYCYENVMKTDPDLEGRVEVRWSVAAGKVVGTPYVVANTTGSGELADCVVKKIRRWDFPLDVEGDMSFPFVFQPK